MLIGYLLWLHVSYAAAREDFEKLQKMSKMVVDNEALYELIKLKGYTA